MKYKAGMERIRHEAEKNMENYLKVYGDLKTQLKGSSEEEIELHVQRHIGKHINEGVDSLRNTLFNVRNEE